MGDGEVRDTGPAPKQSTAKGGGVGKAGCQVNAKMALKQDGGAKWQGKEATSPGVTDKREADRLPRGANVGGGWQGEPSRGTGHSGDTQEAPLGWRKVGLAGICKKSNLL